MVKRWTQVISVDTVILSCLVCQQFYRHLKKIANSYHISAWKSKGLSDESIKIPAASNNSLAPALNYI